MQLQGHLITGASLPVCSRRKRSQELGRKQTKVCEWALTCDCANIVTSFSFFLSQFLYMEGSQIPVTADSQMATEFSQQNRIVEKNSRITSDGRVITTTTIKRSPTTESESFMIYLIIYSVLWDLEAVLYVTSCKNCVKKNKL